MRAPATCSEGRPATASPTGSHRYSPRRALRRAPKCATTSAGTSRVVGARPVTRRQETYIQASFEEHARAAGWLVFHAFDARRSEPGWPDAFCVRNGRALAVELKTATGRVSKAQERWIAELDLVPGV